MSCETYLPPSVRVIEITASGIICLSSGFEKYKFDGDY